MLSSLRSRPWWLVGLVALWGACGSDPAPPTADAIAADAPPGDADPGGDPGADAGPTGPRYADWMADLLAAHPDRDVALIDLALPRAHDAGTYELTYCSLGATACNTQTQRRSTREMLEAGVRAFDVRPVLSEEQDGYFSHHTNSCHGAGCEGASIADMAQETRDFLDAHAELVIWEVDHFCSTGPDDEALLTLIEGIVGDRLYREATPDATPFIQRPLRDVIAPDDGKGKLLILYAGLADTPQARAAGRFAKAFVPIAGSYANAQQLDVMIADQLQRWEAFEADGSALFVLKWAMTMDTEMVVACLTEDEPRSIESMAVEANGALASELDALIAAGSIAAGRIPNLLDVDDADTFATDECLKLSALNLQ